MEGGFGKKQHSEGLFLENCLASTCEERVKGIGTNLESLEDTVKGP